VLLGDKAHSVIFDNSEIRKIVPDFRATIPRRHQKNPCVVEADPSRQIVRNETHQMMDRMLRVYQGRR
jgi:hypothetical protein